MPQSVVTVNHQSSEEISVKVKQKTTWVFSFRPLGKISFKDKNSMDFIDTVSQFSKSELFLLQIVKDNITPNNEAYIKRGKYSSAEQQKLKIAFKSWITKKLLVRLKREHYIINPYFFTPPLDHQADVKIKWDNLP